MMTNRLLSVMRGAPLSVCLSLSVSLFTDTETECDKRESERAGEVESGNKREGRGEGKRRQFCRCNHSRARNAELVCNGAAKKRVAAGATTT